MGEPNKAEQFLNQAKGLFENNKDKIGEALKSDQAEQISDKVLDAAADLAKKVLPTEHSAKVDEVRDNLDGKIGNDS